MPFDYQLHYSRWHTSDPDHVREMVDRTERQLATLLPRTPGRALDVGCGMGFAVRALERLGWEAEGIDTDLSQVHAARSVTPHVAHTEDSAAWIAASETRYDAILLLDVLEHLVQERQVRLLSAAHAALADQGRLILTVPNANNPVAMRWRYDDYTHHYAFTEASVSFLLEGCGFAEIDIRPSFVGRRPPLRLWRPLARSEFRRWLVRKAWEQVLIAELGDPGRDLPIDLNLTVIAKRD
jgi:predicted TPR repeat methyltransferase